MQWEWGLTAEGAEERRGEWGEPQRRRGEWGLTAEDAENRRGSGGEPQRRKETQSQGEPRRNAEEAPMRKK